MLAENFGEFPELTIVKIDQDYYYKDQSHMPFEERLKTNYDHPFAFDTDLLIEHMNKLINFESIEEPVYDYENHTRSIKNPSRAKRRYSY